MSGNEDAVEPGSDAPAAEPSDGEDWFDAEDDETTRSGIPPIVVVLIAVAVLGVVAVLLATSGGSDGDSGSTTSDTAAESSDSGGPTEPATTVAAGPSWPAAVQGRPAVFGKLRDPITAHQADAEPGAYLWLDYDGWHLWMIDPSGKAAARGALVSNADFGDAQTAVPDEGTVAVEGQGLTFDFSGTDAAAAGVSFNLGFYGTELTVSLQGTDLPLLLGKEATPSPIPTVVAKQVQPS